MDTLRNTMSYRSVSINYGNHSESDLMIFGCVNVYCKRETRLHARLNAFTRFAKRVETLR